MGLGTRFLHGPFDGASSVGDTGVAVVIPVYNRRRTLLETLPFVLRQSLAPECVVVVDDGSTDGSAEAAEAWFQRNSPPFEWRVLRQPHANAARARGLGFAHVRQAPLVAFLDSDDHWPVDFLARTATVLKENPHAVAVSADRLFISADEEPIEADDLREMIARPVEWFFERGAGVASCSLFRTAAVEFVGGWDVERSTSEDTVLFTAIAQAGAWLHAPGEPVRFYVGSADARQEETNLSCRHADRHLLWARDYEELYTQIAARDPHFPLANLHEALAYRWTAAAKQLLKLGRPEEARSAVNRALYWRPTSLRAWRHRIGMSLKAPGARAAA
jgi:GT2 family glycosyltransferase